MQQFVKIVERDISLRLITTNVFTIPAICYYDYDVRLCQANSLKH